MLLTSVARLHSGCGAEVRSRRCRTGGILRRCYCGRAGAGPRGLPLVNQERMLPRTASSAGTGMSNRRPMRMEGRSPRATA